MSNNRGDRSEFDDLLESELETQLGHLTGPSRSVTQSAYYAAEFREPSPQAPSGFGSKVFGGLAVAVLGIVAGTAAVTATATGSSDPAVWGKTVVAAVEQCKDQVAGGKEGIGQCVSDVAKQKGAEERAAHAADKDRNNGNAETPGGPASGQPGNGNKPTDAGKPTNVPGGPPASPPGNANGRGNGNGNGPPATPPGQAKP